MKRILAVFLFITFCIHPVAAQIIDVHLHAFTSDFKTQGSSFGFEPVKTADEMLQKTIQKMNAHDIKYGIVSGILESIDIYAKADTRFIPAYSDREELIDINQFESLVKSGKIKVFGEIMAVYKGTTLADPIYQPYLKICEQYDIPVAVHTGGSGPNAQKKWPNYRIYYGDPLLIEDVFANYPNLKVNLMHAGGSFYQHTLRLMAGYRNVYADLGHRLWDSNMSKDWAVKFLKLAKEYGVLERVLFGSDQMYWPDTITASVEFIESLDFLTEEDKNLIFYESGKKFLGIEE